MRVIELRNYLLKDGVTGDFIRCFEEHSLFSQLTRAESLLRRALLASPSL